MSNSRSLVKIDEEGPLAFTLDEMVMLIAAVTPVDKAFLLARTTRKNLSLLLYPTRLRYLQQFAVAEVIIDRNNTYCLTRFGGVFVGSNPQIKNGNFSITRELIEEKQDDGTVIKTPVTLTGIKQALDSGHEFSLFVKTTGELYAKGRNLQDRYPQTYIPPSDTAAVVPAFGGLRIKKVMDDSYSACFLDDAGQMRVVGTDAWGELGQLEDDKRFSEPQLIQDLPHIDDFYYTGRQLFLFPKEGLLVTGKNDKGQLALGHNNNICFPVEVSLNNIKLKKQVKVANKLRFYGLTKDGRVCAWGDNTDQLLGFGDQQEHNFPALLPGLHNIIDFDVSSTHALFVDSEGKVFGIGQNLFGELGVGDKLVRSIPTLIPVSTTRKVFCKTNKSFFVNENTVKFAGKTYAGREVVAIDTPKTIFTNIEKIEKIETYQDEFIIRTADGALYFDLCADRTKQDEVMSFNPKYHPLPPTKKMLEQATIKELLFYAVNKDGFGRFCLKQALEKIEQAITVDQLINVIEEVRLANWVNNSSISEILLGYTTLICHLKNDAKQIEFHAITKAWAELLVVHRELWKEVRTHPSRVETFRSLLLYLSASPCGLFAPQLIEDAYAMLLNIVSPNWALKLAAKFLEPALPKLPADLKRSPEEDLVAPERKIKKPKR